MTKDISYEIRYKPSFIRAFKRLHPQLQEEVEIVIEKLQDPGNHKSLRVHKLEGRLKKFYSCSVNYKNRIVFEFEKEAIIVLLAVGDHDVYK